MRVRGFRWFLVPVLVAILALGLLFYKDTIFVLAQSSESVNLVVNGSFEEPVISGPWQLIADDSLVPGWEIVSGSVLEIQREIFASADGNQHIELDGEGDDSRTAIKQTITTVPGFSIGCCFNIHRGQILLFLTTILILRLKVAIPNYFMG